MEPVFAPLSAIVGQDAAVAALAALVDRGGPVPPLLLHGPDGVGKRSAAIAFAAALVCRQPRGADACGVCPHCRRFADLEATTAMREGSTNADSTTVYPDVGLVGTPKGKTRISVLQARDVIASMGVRPYELERRIYIVDPADKMNPAAANALLKLLEEPPSYGVIVLVTAAPWSLPITVRSRLRQIRFRPLGDADLARLLAARGVAPAEAAARVAQARGSIARALDGDPKKERERIEKWTAILERFDACLPAELAAAASEEFGKKPDLAASELDLLTELLADLAAVAEGAPPRLLDAEQAARLAPLADRLLGPLRERPRLVDRLRRELTIFNRNPRLTIEGAVLALAGRLRPRDLQG